MPACRRGRLTFEIGRQQTYDTPALYRPIKQFKPLGKTLPVKFYIPYKMVAVYRLTCSTALKFISRFEIRCFNQMGFKKLDGQKRNIGKLIYLPGIKLQHINVCPIN